MIHTHVPKISNRPDFSFYDTYRKATKLLPQAKAYILKDSSKFGAIVFIQLENGEIEQLTKKKIRWKDLANNFHGTGFMNLGLLNYQANELMKHGIVIIE